MAENCRKALPSVTLQNSSCLVGGRGQTQKKIKAFMNFLIFVKVLGYFFLKDQLFKDKQEQLHEKQIYKKLSHLEKKLMLIINTISCFCTLET